MRILGTKIIIRTAIRVLFTLFLLPPALAEELHPEGEAPNLVELFVGVTHDDSDNELSVGATYERRLSAGFGVGGIGEYTADREFVLAVAFSNRAGYGNRGWWSRVSGASWWVL